MNYEKVIYSRSRIEKAGRIISSYDRESDEYTDFLPVVDNWRAAHAYPLDEITKIVNSAVCGNENINVVQRLKRLHSIISKLQRKNNTGLYRMQDLGGCRVIIPSIADLYSTIFSIKNNLEIYGHEIKKEDDYISNPREVSGYRSYHLIVKYIDKENSEYNGMMIEIQIRTKLEHKWATAVEILDFMTKDTLKIGTGRKEYMYFFKLISALFSLEEDTPIVDGVPKNKNEIVEEIYKIDNKEQIRQKLSAYNSVIRFSGDYPQDAEYYLLITDTRTETISTRAYNKEEINIATSEYQRIEKNKKNNSLDVVLVAAKSFDIIKECYPNYFMETLSFLSRISELCSEYPEKASIAFSTRNKGKRATDLFMIKRFDANKPYGIRIDDDGIGIEEGHIYVCPDWAISLDDSYLRYTGIKHRDKEGLKKLNYIRNIVQGNGIVVLSTGACFYIDDDDWEFISEVPAMVIQCKENVNKQWLLFLICWLKSNICTWDLIWNRHANSIYRIKGFGEFDIPAPDTEMYEKVCAGANSIIEKEKSFVKYYNEINSENNPQVLESINTHNYEVLTMLIEIERLFGAYYGISQTDEAIIADELQLKGYFAYATKKRE